MYSKIYNPLTNRYVLLKTRQGKQALYNYIYSLKGGASIDDELDELQRQLDLLEKNEYHDDILDKLQAELDLLEQSSNDKHNFNVKKDDDYNDPILQLQLALELDDSDSEIELSPEPVSKQKHDNISFKYLELDTKFWKIERQSPDSLTTVVTYGKIGNKGRTSIKNHDTEQHLINFMDKIVKEKLSKGYKIIKSSEDTVKTVNKSEKIECGSKSKSKTKSKTKSTVTSNKAYKNVFHGKVLLASEYKKKDGSNTINPVGWWASEKFDGYRSIWTGESFVSRNGKPFIVPEWFREIMPAGVALDGEFWMGRGGFSSCGIFRKKNPDEQEWLRQNVQYTVFDVPSLDKPFEERMAYLEKLISERCEYMKTLKLPLKSCPLLFTNQTKIKSEKHLDDMFTDVVEKGGEGIMIREPGSFYEGKRSKTLLKYKQFYDTECVITGYKPGQGKYSGKLGAFECNASIRIASGETIQVPISVSGMVDEIRDNYLITHPIGTVITVTYNELSKDNIPRHPRYLRKRDDACY